MYQIHMQPESPQYLSAKPSFLCRKEYQIFYHANWDTWRCKGALIIILGQHTRTRTFLGGLGSLPTWDLGTCLYLLPMLVSFADLVFDCLPFLPLQLRERTFRGLLLPFLCASCSVFLECCSSHSSFSSTIPEAHQ